MTKAPEEKLRDQEGPRSQSGATCLREPALGLQGHRYSLWKSGSTVVQALTVCDEETPVLDRPLTVVFKSLNHCSLSVPFSSWNHKTTWVSGCSNTYCM